MKDNLVGVYRRGGRVNFSIIGLKKLKILILK